VGVESPAQYKPGGAAVEYIGLDVHRHYTVLARMAANGEMLTTAKVKNADVGETIASYGEPCQVVLESTGNWMYIESLLETQELVEDIALAHPLEVKAIAHARIKTDKVDAKVLAHLLRTDFLPRAYRAPFAVRELRDLLRFRASLVRVRTTVKNKIHAVLIKEGPTLTVTDLFGRGGRRWLASQTLSTVHRLSVDGYLRVVDSLDAEVAGVTAEIDRQAKEHAEVEWLTSIPGIGRYTALLILAEVADISRFSDAQHFASYAGLVPSVHSTGGHTYYGPITKRGSAWLRWALVETVHRNVGRPNPINERYQRLVRRKGSAVASVAVARFLATCVYALLSEERPFQFAREARNST
jgi:transposase